MSGAGSVRAALPGLTVALALTVAVDVEAQDPRPMRERWTLSILTGPAFGGAPAAIEDAMTAQGYGDDLRCIGVCPGVDLEKPNSKSGWGLGGFPVAADLRYVHRRTRRGWYGGSVIVARAYRSETLGFDRESGPVTSGEHLRVLSAVDLTAPTVAVGRGIAWAEAGPAVYVKSTRRGNTDHPAEEQTRTSVGAVAGAGLSVRMSPILSFEVRAQYRFAGTMQVGPYTSPYRRFEAVDVRASHAFVGVGFGLRAG